MNEHIERPVEAVGGEDLGSVLVDLLGAPKLPPVTAGVSAFSSCHWKGSESGQLWLTTGKVPCALTLLLRIRLDIDPVA